MSSSSKTVGLKAAISSQDFSARGDKTGLCPAFFNRITSYNVCYTKLLRASSSRSSQLRSPMPTDSASAGQRTPLDVAAIADSSERVNQPIDGLLVLLAETVFWVRQKLSCSAVVLTGLVRRIAAFTYTFHVSFHMILYGRGHRITSYNVCYTKLVRSRSVGTRRGLISTPNTSAN